MCVWMVEGVAKVEHTTEIYFDVRGVEAFLCSYRVILVELSYNLNPNGMGVFDVISWRNKVPCFFYFLCGSYDDIAFKVIGPIKMTFL